MAAPAIKPCPVCGRTGSFLGRKFAVCDCGMLVERASRAKAAADWNRLSDLAEARTRAAVRDALEEVERFAQGRLASAHAEPCRWRRGVLAQYLAGEATGSRLIAEHIRAQIARLDAAPSAQPEGDADADR